MKVEGDRLEEFAVCCNCRRIRFIHNVSLIIPVEHPPTHSYLLLLLLPPTSRVLTQHPTNVSSFAYDPAHFVFF